MVHNAKFIRRRFGTAAVVAVTLVVAGLLVTGVIMLVS
jgi:hypothetical protein